MTTEEARARRERRLMRIFGALLVVMALVTTGQTAWYSYEQQKCNEAFARNLALRSEWADQDRRAAQRFWMAVYQHPRDRTRNIALFQNWVETFQTNNERRARTSLPNLADCE